MQYLFFYLLTMNALGLVFMLTDKIKARRNAWRIPETPLMLIAALGGSLGAILGMRLFRHKTRHLKFALGLPLLLVLHILLFFILYAKTPG